MTIKQWLRQQKQLSGNYLHFSVALGVLSGFLLILQAWFLAQVVNNVIFKQATLSDNLNWLWLMLLVFLLRALITWSSEQTAFHAAIQIKKKVRGQLFSHLQAVGPVHLANERSGELVNTLSEGVEALESYYSRYLPAISLMALVPLSILVFVFPLDWKSALIMLFTAPLIPFFMILIGTKAEQLNQRQWRVMARMTAYFLDVIQGLTTLKLFNASRREAQVIAKVSDDYRHATMRVLRVAFLSSFVLEFFATVSIAIVAVIIGFRLYWGEMNFLYGFYILLLAPEFYLPLRNMGTHYHARMEAIGATEKILDLLNQPIPEVKDNNRENKLPSFKESDFDIHFNQVSFSYDEHQTVIKDIDLTLKKGQKIAIVGASGSGKTTLTNLLMGFIKPTQGSIMINNIPLNSIPVKEWHKHIAWMPQKAHLFYGSILDNIRLANQHSSLEEVREAAKKAGADNFIMNLPDTYNTIVGEQGLGLSGGQIQRIALSRVFLKNAPLVILDEATANLDLHSEKLVQQGIAHLSQHSSIIIIAHRLSTIVQSDKIFVLHKGQIIQQGKHAELSVTPGHYKTMLGYYRLEIEAPFR